MGKNKTISAIIKDMQIKIEQFNGVYTNMDENDLKFELFRESINFKHEQGYAEFDPHTFVRYGRCFELPDGFDWEKGCIASISSDPMSENLNQKNYQVIVLVCCRKVMIQGDIRAERKIYMSEYGSEIRYGLFKEDSNPLPNLCISEDDFTVLSDQEVFFKNTDGVLKIYLPHMSFWLGRLERTVYRIPLWTFNNPINGYYFDRLVEPYNPEDLGVDLSGGNPVCTKNRRLGFSTSISVVSDQSVVTNEQTIDSAYQGLKQINIGAALDGYGFYFTDHDTGEYVYPLRQYDPNDTKIHLFWRDNDLQQNYILIPVEYNDNLKFADNNSRISDLYGSPIYEPHIAPNGWYENGHSFFRTTIETFNSDIASHGLKWMGQTIEAVGFPNTVKKLDVVVTAILDRKSEMIIYKKTVDTTTEAAKFALKFSDTAIAQDSNARLTGINIFVKAVDYLDYKLCKKADFLDPKEKDITTFYIAENDVEDITLTQMIGFYFDDKTEKYFRLLTGLRDVTVERGYSIALSSYNANTAYYSAVGGGRVMTDIFYISSIIEKLGLNKINAVASANGRFLLLDSAKANIVTISGEGVSPVIDIIDDLEYGCKGRNDIAETQGGIIINTAKGIFLTNGFEKNKLSEQINNLCEMFYDSSFIFYNPVKLELIFFLSVGSKPYRYRFDRGKWEQLYFQDTEAKALESYQYFFDQDGKELILAEDVYIRSGFNALPFASLSTNNSDLGQAFLDKHINTITLDMTGAVKLIMWMDGRTAKYLFTSDIRRSLVLRIPEDRRYPFERFKLTFEVAGSQFSLYKVEMDVSVMKRRDNGKAEIKRISDS